MAGVGVCSVNCGGSSMAAIAGSPCDGLGAVGVAIGGVVNGTCWTGSCDVEAGVGTGIGTDSGTGGTVVC